MTGAGGFIGSHLVECLVQKGASVRAFVRYNSRADAGLLHQLPAVVRAEVEVVAGDLRDGQAMQKATTGMRTIFHLGAVISIPYSYVHPVETVATNFMGTLKVLMAAREQGVERLVQASTSEVYGTAQRVPIGEDHPYQGQSPYSASKIGADKLVESFYRAYGLPAVTVRPFNTFGPRQSARAVIPTIISQALTGDTVYLGNLETRRDFTFVLDTVLGFVKAAEALGGDESDKVVGREINLGTGRDISIGELADLIAGQIGREVIIEQAAERLRPEQSEVMRLIADNELAQRLLGWRPQYDLERGLQETIAWISDHLDAYRVGTYEI